ncbi:MAG: hypothetical protein GF383_01015 [Candidatus Lokiarchaeota archaeon]|nr:hypothetical protein [Candidatus Lokiarchaeota archaeon]MBD3337819.1 hypothetical protein [Candidatus Lokiarchaeota archaeon]
MIISFFLGIFQNGGEPEIDQNPTTDILNDISGYGNTLFFLIIVLICWFVASSILAYWTYKDIQKKQLTGYSYVIIVFLTSIIGLIIYYIVRYNEKCALELDEDACVLEDEDDI